MKLSPQKNNRPTVKFVLGDRSLLSFKCISVNQLK